MCFWVGCVCSKREGTDRSLCLMWPDRRANVSGMFWNHLLLFIADVCAALYDPARLVCVCVCVCVIS